jgi:hypothetical protein
MPTGIQNLPALEGGAWRRRLCGAAFRIDLRYDVISELAKMWGFLSIQTNLVEDVSRMRVPYFLSIKKINCVRMKT